MTKQEADQLAWIICRILPNHLQVEVVSHYGIHATRYKVHIWHLVPDPREQWEWWINTPAEWVKLRQSIFVNA